MRVLLVYSNRTIDPIEAPPIGMSYVATATRRAGHTVRFLDLLIADDPYAALDAAMREFRPEAVGISVRNIDNTVQQKLRSHLGELAEFIARIRTAGGQRIPIILGGPAISILGASALDYIAADYAVCGEGEVSFPALLAALEAGREPEGIAGLCSRNGAKISASAHLPVFGASGMQDWIDWPRYARRGGTFAIQSKRGCPMACNYCSYPEIEGRKVRRRDPVDVVDEIEAVHRRLAPRAFEFVDSTFNIPEAHALAICEEIIRRRLKVRLTAQGINPSVSSRELFALMKRAGFNSMMITPESGSDVVLANLEKGFDMRDVARTARLARESGLRSVWFFMLGSPGETRATVEETLCFVEASLRGGRFLSIFMTGVRMLPGTRLSTVHAAPGTDLAQPVFYLSKNISEEWMLQRVNETVRRQPNVVHAAEEGISHLERWLQRALYTFGVAPPYWRFLPYLLGCPPLHALRRNNPAVGGLSRGRGAN